MQLETPGTSAGTTSALRERLGKAALALLLVPASAGAADSGAKTQIDYTTLLYGEQGRAQVVEPILRATRLFSDGQSFSLQLGFDSITGASPSGALPSGSFQSRTSPSGRVTTLKAGEIPTTSFSDRRTGLDAEWQKPFGGRFTTTIGAHASTEKDYDSLGVNGKVSVDLMQHLLTVSVGAGYSDDSVSPVGGTPLGLSDGSVVTHGANAKRVSSALLGISRVLSRRWLVGIDVTRFEEKGYLTEPYKVISLVDQVTGFPLDQVTDKRPSTRSRTSVLFSSVYHLTDDVVYASYRYYTDSWKVRSTTSEVSYRHDLDESRYFEPHARFYQQNAASFFTPGLVLGQDLPQFATADQRLGRLTTYTIGATYAFPLFDLPGLWTVRADYIRQEGVGNPPSAVGVQQNFNLAPAVNTTSLVVGYSFKF